MKYFCCDERRRNRLRTQKVLNGIDYLEVWDDPEGSTKEKDRQCTLNVHFIHDLQPGALTSENIRIVGGERIKGIRVTDVTVGGVQSSPDSPPGDMSKVLTVKVDVAGDFSMYTLRLHKDTQDDLPPAGFDPVLAAVDFSFKVACPSDFDCMRRQVCPKELKPALDINYLAKDYASFRQLMLDRLAILLPQRQERNAADLGTVLVELLAYVGDYLSYTQDAIATEAYLGTARKRISVRRHARLVDYFMHDGCNARTWVHVKVRDGVEGLELKKGSGKHVTKLMTHIPGEGTVMAWDDSAHESGHDGRPEVFELVHSIKLYKAHNEMHFHTWGERECCLPRGATCATLRKSYPNLKPGDVLIFKERIGPQNLKEKEQDADPERRHAVRLTEVDWQDKHGNTLTDALTGQEVTEIEWHLDDALPFPLCISSRVGTTEHRDVSVALGNIVLADHGCTEEQKYDDPVPDPVLLRVPMQRQVHCADQHELAAEQDRLQVLPRFHPSLKKGPLTQAGTFLKTENKDGHPKEERVPFDPDDSALAVFNYKMEDVLPAINLKDETGTLWELRRDLLSSDEFDQGFVVETEEDGTARLRFGDGRCGLRPAPGTVFTATYRVGNGTSGNIGAETLAHIMSDDPALTTELDNSPILEVQNPLPARGGVEPESIEQVRQRAPSAMRTQARAVTCQDYEYLTHRDVSGVQRAAATLRWTGSWYTAFVTVDRLGGAEVDEAEAKAFEKKVRSRLERYRMAGRDVEVDEPRYVSLHLEMTVHVKSDYLRSDVKTALLEVFSSGLMPDGRRGVFHPDNFTFGQTVYLSPLYAAAQKVAGVDLVEITRFQRQGTPDDKALVEDKLTLGRLEIARLENDPSFPEHGILNFTLRGGR